MVCVMNYGVVCRKCSNELLRWESDFNQDLMRVIRILCECRVVQCRVIYCDMLHRDAYKYYVGRKIEQSSGEFLSEK